MSKTILCNLSDANEIIDEERSYWMFEVLDGLNVPDEVYDANNIDDYRDLMHELGVEVGLRADKGVDIYKLEWHEGETEEQSGWLPAEKKHLVAQWNKPVRTKISEGVNVYYKLKLNEWSFLSAKV